VLVIEFTGDEQQFLSVVFAPAILIKPAPLPALQGAFTLEWEQVVCSLLFINMKICSLSMSIT
jgi:hypothetical protein